jgi:hypothetical protein
MQLIYKYLYIGLHLPVSKQAGQESTLIDKYQI